MLLATFLSHFDEMRAIIEGNPDEAAAEAAASQDCCELELAAARG